MPLAARPELYTSRCYFGRRPWKAAFWTRRIEFWTRSTPFNAFIALERWAVTVVLASRTGALSRAVGTRPSCARLAWCAAASVVTKRVNLLPFRVPPSVLVSGPGMPKPI